MRLKTFIIADIVLYFKICFDAYKHETIYYNEANVTLNKDLDEIRKQRLDNL